MERRSGAEPAQWRQSVIEVVWNKKKGFRLEIKKYGQLYIRYEEC